MKLDFTVVQAAFANAALMCVRDSGGEGSRGADAERPNGESALRRASDLRRRSGVDKSDLRHDSFYRLRSLRSNRCYCEE